MISVQVIDKSRGKYRVYKTMGSSSVPVEIENLYIEGQAWIKRHIGNTDLFFNLAQEQRKQSEMEETRRVLDNVEYLLINGTLTAFIVK